MLKDSAVLAKAMLNAIPDLMFRMTKNGTILDYKAETKDLYIRSPADFLGMDIHKLMPRDFCSVIDEQIFTAFATDKLQTFEYDLILPERGKCHYEARMAKSGADEVTAIIRDITEQDFIKKELQESREAIDSFFNMGIIGMCITTPEKGWKEVNDHLCGLLGYSRDELTKMTWAELTHPDDLSADTALFDAVIRDERDSYQLEKWFIRKNGDAIDTLLYVVCQRNPDRSVRHFFASLVDITERKKRWSRCKDRLKKRPCS